MKRVVEIEIEVKGLQPEEKAVLYLAILPVIDDVMEFLGVVKKGEND